MIVAGALGAAAVSACSSSSSAPGTSPGQDSGMVSLGDSSVDGPEEAGPDSTMMNDSSSDTSIGSDGSDADAGHSPCPGGATPVHLPAGFSQVLASAVDQGFGGGVSMALDENDDPMFAYLAVTDSRADTAPRPEPARPRPTP